MLSSVTIDHVTYFVPEHARQLPGRGQFVQQPLGDENLSAGQGERIDGFWVSQDVKLKVVGRLFGIALGHDLLADLVYQLLIARIGIFSAVLGRHLRRRLQTQTNFLVGRHGDVLLMMGHRIVDAVSVVRNQRDDGDDGGNHQPPDKRRILIAIVHNPNTSNEVLHGMRHQPAEHKPM